MSVESPGERPLALRDLAETDSPEIVRAALGRFRRRLLVRGLILVLAIAAGLVLYPRYFRVEGDLIHDVAHARGTNNFQLINAGDLDVVLRKVGRIHADALRPERFGIEMIVSKRDLALNERLETALYPQGNDRGIIEVLTGTGTPFFPSLRIWMTLAVDTPTVDIPISIVTLANGGITSKRADETIHLDMQQLGIPDPIWRR